MEVYCTIKRKDFNKWQELFVTSGGRYLSNPVIDDEEIRVSYKFYDINDANTFNLKWYRLTTDIIETHESFIKKIIRKIGLHRLIR